MVKDRQAEFIYRGIRFSRTHAVGGVGDHYQTDFNLGKGVAATSKTQRGILLKIDLHLG